MLHTYYDSAERGYIPMQLRCCQNLAVYGGMKRESVREWYSNNDVR